MICIGPMIFATIVATFSSYVHSAEVSLENIDHRLKTVSAYITNLPDGLYKKVFLHIYFINLAFRLNRAFSFELVSLVKW